MRVDNEIISSGTVLFTAPKHFDFVNPSLSVTVCNDEIKIKADAYAKSVEIYSDETDLILSDNFFDINGGEVTVKVLEIKETTKKAESASMYEVVSESDE